jgi:hypothetical protein
VWYRTVQRSEFFFLSLQKRPYRAMDDGAGKFASMKHAVVRWNPATREHFCARCGRTSDATSIADAQEQLEQYDCLIPSVNVSVPEPGTETVRLNRKNK